MEGLVTEMGWVGALLAVAEKEKRKRSKTN